ncbi:MAG: SDR family NAD(P)-dependent oxidoreductase [Alphaproteobacteria bacterium]|nr:SDR family NAD(P)-dependent oxidoreductase [Alphaproteobacteria bacterium]
MDLNIKGRKALVTGAGRGLGRAIATSLAREGAIIAAVARTQADVENLVESIGGTKAGHRALALDLMPEGAPAQLMDRLQDFGDLDIVVHNVGGTLDISDPFCSTDQWRAVYRFNFEIAVELNGYFLPGMRQRKWGRVCHVSSISAMENHGPVPYCAMKAALTAYTRSMGGVVAPDGVVLTAVLPGAVFTEKGYWDIASHERPEHVKKYLTERQRIGRFGRPEEIGNCVAYLCSDLASFNTGSIVPIDGGQGRGYFGQ